MRPAPLHAVFLALFLLLTSDGGALDAEQVAEEGQPPPLFSLPDENGVVHNLESFLGTPTVLYFTHNMCHYCTQIIGFLKRTRPLYSEEELAIVTINVWADGEKLIRRYKEQFGLPFPMLAGKNPQLLRDYEVNYVPIVVFLDRDGRIHRIFHHYILAADFDRSVKEIVEGAQAQLPNE
ncbi:MAG: TlpA family protein disulfide reductase [bacterium]|nr:TlpA family protein disulfide reductase [bacterium]